MGGSTRRDSQFTAPPADRLRDKPSRLSQRSEDSGRSSASYSNIKNRHRRPPLRHEQHARPLVWYLSVTSGRIGDVGDRYNDLEKVPIGDSHSRGGRTQVA